MPPTRKPVKMNLNVFHKGHSAEGEGDLPLGPSGAPDERGGGRWEEDRPPRDRPSRDDDGPSRADGDGEWRQSGGRRGGGFRGGGGGGGDFGDRGRGGDSGSFRSGGDSFRSGSDRESGFRSGGGGGFGGDRGGFGADRGGERGSDRGGFGGERGDSRRGGFGGGFERGADRGGERAGGGEDRWRRSGDGGSREGGREEGSGWREGGRESGFGGGREGGGGFRGSDREGGGGGFSRGGDRSEGGGFRGGDSRRDGGSSFSDRRGESGDVRASSGYKPLQLKKKGEAVDGPVEPARRSDIFSGPPSASRDPLPRDSRDNRDSRDSRGDSRDSRDNRGGDVRGGDARGDAVVIHKSIRGDREARDRDNESDRESSSKPARSSREEVSSPKPEVEKSALERALDQKETVSIDDLTEGLETLKITPDNRSQFHETIAKSLFSNKLNLKDVIETLEEKTPKDAPVYVLGVLQTLKAKKGDASLLAMIAHAKVNIIDVIAKGQTPEALEKLLTSSSLLCLKPASALEEHVTKSLTEGKQSPDEILEYINKNADAKQNVSALGGAIGTRVGQLIFQDPATPNFEAITQYSKLVKRAVSQPKVDARGMIAVLYGLQKAWDTAKMPKGTLKPIFEKLYQAKLITWEGFDAWREDRDNKTPTKLKALVQVNSFLDSIKPKEVEEEDEGDDEGDDQEEE